MVDTCSLALIYLYHLYIMGRFRVISWLHKFLFQSCAQPGHFLICAKVAKSTLTHARTTHASMTVCCPVDKEYLWIPLPCLSANCTKFSIALLTGCTYNTEVLSLEEIWEVKERIIKKSITLFGLLKLKKK